MTRDEAIEAAATVVRELFGQPCPNTRISSGLDFIPCGSCDACKRDWIPEAAAIVAVPLDELAAALARISRAQSALVATGYFTEDQVIDDIAPRVTELAAAVPALLNDLADAVQDAIENDRRSHNVVPGLGFAVELETAKKIARDAVRAAAEGWGA